jgi:HAD superfamily phosphatase (TIGR01668 family)
VGRLERYFRPDRHYDRIASVDLHALHADGIRGLILDLDNTLVPWRSAEIPEDVAGWAHAATGMGFQLCIASNTRRYGRLSKVAEALGATYVTNVSKPRRGGFRRAAQQMGLQLDLVAVVGDQLLTDILAAKRLGVHAILVDRLAAHEFVITKFNRLVENLIARALARADHAP